MIQDPDSIKSIKLRPFPYPFKSGLAICSDIDDCDLDKFIQIHRFLNSPKYGLGLPVSDSFFAITSENNQLAYFAPDGSLRPEAEFIKQAVRDGLIDSLHSWGDFNDAPPNPDFLKRVADWLTNEFAKASLKVPIWINHGSPNNYQNLYSRLFQCYQGDDPASSFYTMPHIQNLGIKYYWWSELLGWPLSANGGHAFLKRNKRICINHIKNCIKLFCGRSIYIRSSKQMNVLAEKVRMRDGNSLLGFTRFAADPDRQKLWWPTRHSLRYSLAESVLDRLISEEGYLIIYNHLGKPAFDGNKLFPAEDEKALKTLAKKFHEGLIWVASTSSLLNYWLVSQCLDWQARMENGHFLIDINNLQDPVEGPRLPEESELAGLCFYTPDPGKTIVRLGGRKLSVRKFSADETGFASVGFDIPLPPGTGLVE